MFLHWMSRLLQFLGIEWTFCPAILSPKNDTFWKNLPRRCALRRTHAGARESRSDRAKISRLQRRGRVRAGVFAAGSYAIFIAAIRLGRAMVDAAFEITAERWMGFTTILFLALSILANLEAAGGALRHCVFLFLPLQVLWDAAVAAELRCVVCEKIEFDLFRYPRSPGSQLCIVPGMLRRELDGGGAGAAIVE